MEETVSKILDALAANHHHGWEYHKEDGVYIYIKHINGKRPPHCRIRRDNADVEMLGKAQFYVDGAPIGWRLSGERFLQLLDESRQQIS